MRAGKSVGPARPGIRCLAGQVPDSRRVSGTLARRGRSVAAQLAWQQRTLHFANGFDEFADIFEILVHRGKTYVRDLVELLEPGHENGRASLREKGGQNVY